MLRGVVGPVQAEANGLPRGVGLVWLVGGSDKLEARTDLGAVDGLGLQPRRERRRTMLHNPWIAQNDSVAFATIHHLEVGFTWQSLDEEINKSTAMRGYSLFLKL